MSMRIVLECKKFNESITAVCRGTRPTEFEAGCCCAMGRFGLDLGEAFQNIHHLHIHIHIYIYIHTLHMPVTIHNITYNL